MQGGRSLYSSGRGRSRLDREVSIIGCPRGGGKQGRENGILQIGGEVTGRGCLGSRGKGTQRTFFCVGNAQAYRNSRSTRAFVRRGTEPTPYWEREVEAKKIS